MTQLAPVSLLMTLAAFASGCCETKNEIQVSEARASVSASPAAVPTGSSGQSANQSFSRSKKQLAGVYSDHRMTLYCGCKYDDRKVVDRASCGYVPARDNARARRIEWEHVVPAHAFGQSFPEWRDGHPDCVNSKGKPFKGRQCARKAALAFRYMEADMYNLYPAVGELNGLRSNFSMATIDGEARAFGRCDFEVADRKVEPRPEVRGDIARTYMYMAAAYPGRGIISRKNRRLFEGWSQADPVDSWECERARRIARIQRNTNKFVDDACRTAGL